MSEYDKEVNGEISVETSLAGLGGTAGMGFAAAGMLAGANNPLANLGKLKEAMELQKLIPKGLSYDERLNFEDEIFQKTGWGFDDVSKQWEFEIPEAGAKFKFAKGFTRKPAPVFADMSDWTMSPSELTMSTSGGVQYSGRAKDFVDHPPYDLAIPGSGDIKMSQVPFGLEDPRGAITRFGLDVSSNLSPFQAAQVTAHEFEHLGADVSGRPSGSSVAQVRRIPELRDRVAREGAFKTYEDVLGEAKARLVSDRMRRHAHGEDVYSTFWKRGYDRPTKDLINLSSEQGMPISGPTTPGPTARDAPPIAGFSEVEIPPLKEGTTAARLASYLGGHGDIPSKDPKIGAMLLRMVMKGLRP